MPPSALMALNPSVPSEAVPERITPIAWLFRSAASERKKRSMGRCSFAVPLSRGRRVSTSCEITMSALGGITWTRSGSRRIPFSTWVTIIVVALARASLRKLGCVRSRCWTRTRAIPLPAGRCLSSSVKASSPPADAPMPTTGKSLPRPGLGGVEVPLSCSARGTTAFLDLSERALSLLTASSRSALQQADPVCFRGGGGGPLSRDGAHVTDFAFRDLRSADFMDEPGDHATSWTYCSTSPLAAAQVAFQKRASLTANSTQLVI